MKHQREKVGLQDRSLRRRIALMSTHKPGGCPETQRSCDGGVTTAWLVVPDM